MEFMVIAYSLLAFIVFVVIFGRIGLKEDHKNKRIDYIIGLAENANMNRELELSFYDRIVKPQTKKVKDFIASKAPKKNESKSDEKKSKLERQLRLAGMFIDVEEFNFVKTIIMVVCMALSLIIAIVVRPSSLIMLAIVAGGGMIGMVGPTYYVSSRVTSHQQGIKKQLPDAMDMLSVCIEAGLSFDGALIKVAEKLSGPFIDELMIVHREIQMGRSRREALQNLSDSTDIEQLKTFASALAQAETLGIPINNVMRVQSEQLRLQRSQEAEEKGRKATIKMLVPMLLFIFPVVFIVVLGPTVMNIIQQFSS